MNKTQAQAALRKAEADMQELVDLRQRFTAETANLESEAAKSLASAKVTDLITLVTRRESARIEVEARKSAVEELTRRIDLAQAAVYAARDELGAIEHEELDADLRRRAAEVLPLLADAVARLQVIASAWPQGQTRDIPFGVSWARTAVNKIENERLFGEKLLAQ